MISSQLNSSTAANIRLPNSAKQSQAKTLTAEELEAHQNPQIMENPQSVSIRESSYGNNPGQHFVHTAVTLEDDKGTKQLVNLDWLFKAFKAKGDQSFQLKVKQENPKPFQPFEQEARQRVEASRLANVRTDSQRKSAEFSNESFEKINTERRKWSSTKQVSASELPAPLRTALLKHYTLTDRNKNPTHTSDKKGSRDRESALKSITPEIKQLVKVLKEVK